MAFDTRVSSVLLVSSLQVVFLFVVAVSGQRNIVFTTSISPNCSNVTSSSSQSNLSCAVDLRYTSMRLASQWDVWTSLILSNDGLPQECRTDVCHNGTTSSREKGSIAWPTTQLGWRSIQICPYYTALNVVYAYRDCQLDGLNRTVWGEPQNNFCPGPFFSMRMNRVGNRTKNYMWNATTYTYSMCVSNLTTINMLVRVRHTYPDQPVFNTDLNAMIDLCTQWIKLCRIYTDLLPGIFNASDMVFGPGFRDYWTLKDFIQFLQYFKSIVVPFNNNYNNNYNYNNYNNYNYVINTNLSSGYGSTNSNFTYDGSDVSVLIQTTSAYYGYDWDGNTSIVIRTGPDVNVGQLQSFVIRNPSALRVLNNVEITSGRLPWPFPTMRIPSVNPPFRNVSTSPTTISLYDTNTASSTIAPSRPLISDSTPGRTSSLPPTMPTSNLSMITVTPTTTYKGVYIIGPFIYVNIFSNSSSTSRSTSNNNGKGMYGSIKGNNSSSSGTKPTPVSTPFNISIRNPQFIPVSFQNRYQPIMEITISFLVCGYTDPELNILYVDCVTYRVSPDVVMCQCPQQGYVGVFTLTPVEINRPTTTASIVQDLSVFLGFPYSKELNLAGQVLRGVSLFCLAATILSFLIFRKARKGIPTRILLHLCFSLICLLVVLYIAEHRSSSQMECRIYNVFRYYLALVSLMWNAVEAYNMYRMLVKVFSEEHSHYLLKTGIVAWGVPVLAVVIAFIADSNAFDGAYSKCTFRCSLKPSTLFYGWLIPMGLIIVHNLFVFAIVIKVLFKHISIGQVSGKERSTRTRLCGAFTMLVLLGVPWIFSAFGVINTGDNSELQRFQGAVGVIFVTFISIQGLFIFGFHCLRNAAIRSHWTVAIWLAILCFRNIPHRLRELTSGSGSSLEDVTSVEFVNTMTSTASGAGGGGGGSGSGGSGSGGGGGSGEGSSAHAMESNNEAHM